MVDKNIRFGEAHLPPEMPPSYRNWHDGSFTYGGFIFAFAVWRWTSVDRELRVVRLHQNWNTDSRVMRWEWRSVNDFNTTYPEIVLALQMWSQGGCGEMSLAEFLNVTVPQ